MSSEGVYVTSSPVMSVGKLHRLPGSCITVVDISKVATFGTVSQMGLEARKLYEYAHK